MGQIISPMFNWRVTIENTHYLFQINKQTKKNTQKKHSRTLYIIFQNDGVCFILENDLEKNSALTEDDEDSTWPII